MSGVTEMQKGALASEAAGLNSKEQQAITLSNEQLKQNNYWNALGVLSGNAQMSNPLGYAGTATSAGTHVAQLSQAVTASQQSQLLSTLGGLAGGAFGAAGNAGGFAPLFGHA